MSIVEKAMIEMKKAEHNQSDIDTMRAILQKFFSHWNSGGAVSVMAPVMERLLYGLPLTPLTGSEDEWITYDNDVQLAQNYRCSSVLKDPQNGKVFDVNNEEWDGTFPYWPTAKVV